METNQAFVEVLVKSLVGERGHIPIARALKEVPVELAGKRIEGVPYSIFQLLSHMSYWQNFLLTYLDGHKPQMPSSVDESWPQEATPENIEEWLKLIEQFLRGIDRSIEYARSVQLDDTLEHFPTETNAGILRNIASHNSYHLGEIVVLRRLFGSWPPPGGGYPV